MARQPAESISSLLPAWRIVTFALAPQTLPSVPYYGVTRQIFELQQNVFADRKVAVVIGVYEFFAKPRCDFAGSDFLIQKTIRFYGFFHPSRNIACCR
jgi:hypothetical protein